MSINLPQRLESKDLPRVSVTLHTQIMHQAIAMLRELKWNLSIETLEDDFPCVRLKIPVLDHVYMIVFSKNGTAHNTQVELRRVHPYAAIVVSIKEVAMIRQTVLLFRSTTDKHRLLLQAFTESKETPTEVPEGVLQKIKVVPKGLEVTLYSRHRQTLVSVLN